MTEQYRPYPFCFRFKMEQMKKIKAQHPEISQTQLNSEIENRWLLVDKQIKKQEDETYKADHHNYSCRKRDQYMRKKTAYSQITSSSQKSNER